MPPRNLFIATVNTMPANFNGQRLITNSQISIGTFCQVMNWRQMTLGYWAHRRLGREQAYGLLPIADQRGRHSLAGPDGR